MSLRGQIFQTLTGQKADVDGKPSGDLRGMLLAVGGRSTKTQSGIDLTKAAVALQVSRRTVERWVKAAETGVGQKPSPAHSKALMTKSRQAATTKAGRRQAIAASSVLQAAKARGARLSITGMQGPTAGGRDYLRYRTTLLELEPDQVDGMIAAWEAGGDKGFMAWATSTWGDDYLPGWGFSDVSDIDMERLSGGKWQ